MSGGVCITSGPAGGEKNRRRLHGLLRIAASILFERRMCISCMRIFIMLSYPFVNKKKQQLYTLFQLICIYIYTCHYELGINNRCEQIRNIKQPRRYMIIERCGSHMYHIQTEKLQLYAAIEKSKEQTPPCIQDFSKIFLSLYLSRALAPLDVRFQGRIKFRVAMATMA